MRIFHLFFLVSLLIIAGCSKPECERNSDCLARACNSVKCLEGKCSYTTQAGCCGNLMCEADKGENYCSCADDCKTEKCEGFIEIEKTKYGAVYTKYLKQYCQGAKCIAGVPAEDIREISLLDERQMRSLKLSSIIRFSKPFDITEVEISIELEVKDLASDVQAPIKFTEIKVISGEMLYGDKEIAREITGPGQSFTETILLDSYTPQKLEEEKSITIKIDYEYTQVVDKAGTAKRVTETYENALSERIYLVNPAGVK